VKDFFNEWFVFILQMIVCLFLIGGIMLGFTILVQKYIHKDQHPPIHAERCAKHEATK
jgi:uncharacterized protein YneF (UPF0154 family)